MRASTEPTRAAQPVPAEPAVPAGLLRERIRSSGPGLPDLVERARSVWVARAAAAGCTEPQAAGGPGWQPFEDQFPTFYQFTNRPR